MKPPAFDYHRAESLEHALELLTEHEDAKIIAGGQSLLPMMALRLARPEVLIDIGHIPGLDTVRSNGSGLDIGALVTHERLERLEVPSDDPRSVFVHAARHIGHRPIRTRGTLGGSLAHADPAAEWCVLAVALRAELAIRSLEGERTEATEDFLQGPFWSSLEETEIITAVRVADFPDAAGFDEHARRHGDFALVLAAVAYQLQGERIAAPRVVLGGVGPTPVRMTAAEEVLDGETPSPELIREAAATARREVDPPQEEVTSTYRRRLAETLVLRAAHHAARLPEPRNL